MEAEGLASHPYPHIDIDPEKEIRILELLPGDLDDEICCKLSKQTIFPDHDVEYRRDDETGNYYLDSADLPAEYSDPSLSYEALSYAWGAKSETMPIEVDGQTGFLVTKNLHACLRRVRYPDRTRRLWADQICIDQENISERNHQVRRMWKIYHQAAKVIVWLGEPQESPLPEKISAQDSALLKENSFFEAATYLVERDPMTGDDSWWYRSWVVQEFVSAREVPVVYFGPFHVQWGSFWQEIYSSNVPRLSSSSWGILRRCGKLGEQRHKLRNDFYGRRCNVFSLVDLFQNTKCSETKDKLYSFLGLLSKAEREAITVDYEEDIKETFANATRAFISANKSLGVLALVTKQRGHQREGQFPSWVIDFRMSSTEIETVPSVFYDPVAEIFSAEPSPWLVKFPHTSPQVQYEPEQKFLSIKGLVFDHVGLAVDDRYAYSTNFCGLKKYWNRHVRQPKAQRKFGKALVTHSPFEFLLSNDTKGPGSSRGSNLDVRRGVETLASVHFVHSEYEILELYHKNLSTMQNSQLEGWEFDSIAYYRAYPSWTNYFEFIGKYMPRLITTECGFMGLGPGTVKEGDVIVLPYGSRQPMLLRSVAKDTYTFQSFVYMPGIMKDELYKNMPDLELEEREFKLV